MMSLTWQIQWLFHPQTRDFVSKWSDKTLHYFTPGGYVKSANQITACQTEKVLSNLVCNIHQTVNAVWGQV